MPASQPTRQPHSLPRLARLLAGYYASHTAGPDRGFHSRVHADSELAAFRLRQDCGDSLTLRHVLRGRRA